MPWPRTPPLPSPSSWPAKSGPPQSARVSSKISPPPSLTAPRSTEGWGVVSQVLKLVMIDRLMISCTNPLSQVGGRGAGRAGWGGRLDEVEGGLLPVSYFDLVQMAIVVQWHCTCQTWVRLFVTHWLTFSRLDWCVLGVWRCQIKTCWCCYCCRCWWWGSC